MGLISWIKSFFSSDSQTQNPDISELDEPTDEEIKLMENWDKEKTQMMVGLLGEEFELVAHSIIPYAIGGALDLYYYPSGVPGLGVATKELSSLPGKGPSNNVYPNYELVMFTRHPLDTKTWDNPKHPLGMALGKINTILNMIARYSAQATLNPNETCEFPADMEIVGGKCLVFDGYEPKGQRKEPEFGLLLIMEVHRSEMQWAREHGTGKLIDKLKQAGQYPYSDMDRKPVV